jgi:hypothetical protein
MQLLFVDKKKKFEVQEVVFKHFLALSTHKTHSGLHIWQMFGMAALMN